MEDKNIGLVYGRLTVVSFSRKKATMKLYMCKCECGNTREVYMSNLRQGYTKSCGCYGRERTSERSKTHGERKTRLYSIWTNMKTRCTNEKVAGYKDYGARGIKICNEWLNSYEMFRDWSLENGYDDSLTIEREDYNGNYEPNNCKWIKPEMQARNRRCNLMITLGKEELPLKTWCNRYGLNYKVVHQSIKRRGFTPEQALQVYIKKKKEVTL